MTTLPTITAELASVSKVYETAAATVRAVQAVDLAVHQGEFLSIVGRSGSGKSSLLHLLGGVELPTAGVVKIRGRDVGAMSESERAKMRRRDVGYVFQSFNLVPQLTVIENVALPLLLDGRERRSALEIAADALARVGMSHRTDHRSAELSGGEQQRTAVARMTAFKPFLILADEPTGNLDSDNADTIISLLRELVDREGKTVVVATHDHSVAARSDRVLGLRDGKIAFLGDPREFLAQFLQAMRKEEPE